MRWIYLSPHFDDVVLSCGGVIWQQVQAGHTVEIWTICAGDPPAAPLLPFAAELHARWQIQPGSVAARAAEDAAACQQVGASWRHFSMPDCIYRTQPDGSPLIHSRDDLFDPRTPLHPQEVEKVRQWLAADGVGSFRLVSPLTLGGHIDHRLTRAAAEALGCKVWYYPDYPYVVTEAVNVRAWLGAGWQRRRIPVSAAGLAAWQAGIAQYRSQLSTFWGSLDEMRAAMGDYLEQGGNSLWSRRSTHSPILPQVGEL